MEEMERLHSLDPAEVPEDSRFLLDFDPDDLAEGDISNQEHWILAMRAARIAGMRARGQKSRWQSRHDPPTRAFHHPTLTDTIRADAFTDLEPSTGKRPSEAALSLLEPSNKQRQRRRKQHDDTIS